MKKNLIFVLIDGARVDKLDKSDKFQEICKRGFLFNNVTTTFPYTVGAVNSIFTGMYGKENGVDSYYNLLGLKETSKTFTQILKQEGYFTCCDLLHENVISKKGFDIHQAHDEYHDDLVTRHSNMIRNALKKSGDSPFFCFLHFTNIHRETVSEILKKYEWDEQEFYDNINENEKRYNSIFNISCSYIKKIIESIDELGITDSTNMIFFSDHGTGLGERYGERNYGSFTYEETIRTFYLFLGKEIQENRISTKLHSSLDIFPTILDLSEIENTNSNNGKSLWSALNGGLEHEEEYTFSETGALHGPFPSPDESNVFCIKSKKYKLIFFKNPDVWELYDLDNDPEEKNNLIDKNLDCLEELKERLVVWINR
ncbi:MAG: sulfatase [Nitrospina sp.]|nr:sulfatase [Nitrospina sp.]|tara:strand:- start:7871 stop:8980 length:1110 start_codon:yes stop_codon:yes gene_type:complete